MTKGLEETEALRDLTEETERTDSMDPLAPLDPLDSEETLLLSTMVPRQLILAPAPRD